MGVMLLLDFVIFKMDSENISISKDGQLLGITVLSFFFFVIFTEKY
jgi:hypothetical protein